MLSESQPWGKIGGVVTQGKTGFRQKKRRKGYLHPEQINCEEAKKVNDQKKSDPC